MVSLNLSSSEQFIKAQELNSYLIMCTMLLSSGLFKLTLKSPPSMIFELGCKLLILAISDTISKNCYSLLELLLLGMYTLSIITFSPFILT